MFQILLLLRSLLLHNQASPAPPMATRGCPETCGGVAIPFPFGIGTRCSLDKWYEIVCQNGTVPILNKANLRVLDIALTDMDGERNSMIKVSLPITYSSNVSCSSNGSSTPLSLKGNQFVFSASRNVFAGVGCNRRAQMNDAEFTTIRCNSSCGAEDNVVRNTTCSDSDGCCQTRITSVLQAFSIDFQHIETAGDNGCNIAFLGNRSQFTPSVMDFNRLKASRHFAAVLEWGIANSSTAALEIYNYSSISNKSYKCSSGSFDAADPMAMPFLQCVCMPGFTRNPYLKDGCEVVDERKGLTNRYLGRKCAEIPDPAYVVDYTKNFPLLLIVVEAGLGVLLLCLISWRLYKCIKKRKKPS